MHPKLALEKRISLKFSLCCNFFYVYFIVIMLFVLLYPSSWFLCRVSMLFYFVLYIFLIFIHLFFMFTFLMHTRYEGFLQAAHTIIGCPKGGSTSGFLQTSQWGKTSRWWNFHFWVYLPSFSVFFVSCPGFPIFFEPFQAFLLVLSGTVLHMHVLVHVTPS